MNEASRELKTLLHKLALNLGAESGGDALKVISLYFQKLRFPPPGGGFAAALPRMMTHAAFDAVFPCVMMMPICTL